MKTICTWLWNDGSTRSKSFAPAHVNALRKMIARNLPEPHRFVCIADSSEGFDPEVEVMPTPEAAKRLGELKSPEGGRFPSCYRRLWMFSDEARVLGERVLLIDIDLVVVADITPIFEPTDEFVGWRPFRDWGNQCRFGGGIYLLTPGTRTNVWNDFTGPKSIAEARAAGFRGSDQAWISYKLSQSNPYWDRESGIFSIRDFRTEQHNLPADARLVQMNGPIKPWMAEAQRIPWIRQHWG
jgi:hypothetical protein